MKTLYQKHDGGVVLLNNTMQISIIKFIIPIFFVAAPFLVPSFHLSPDTGTILTVISLLFAILIGFFISSATANYLRLQTLIASMNSSLITIYSYSKIIGGESHVALTKSIDTYLIATLDFDVLDFSGKVDAEFSEILKNVDAIRPHDDIGMGILQHLHYGKINLISNDEEIEISAKSIVNPLHWFILTILAGLIIILLMSLSDGGLAYATMAAALNFTIFQVLFLLYKLDQNIFLARKLAFNFPQRVFSAIGCMPYFPEYATKFSHVTLPKDQPYRIGSFVGAGAVKRKIRIVKLKNNRKN